MNEKTSTILIRNKHYKAQIVIYNKEHNIVPFTVIPTLSLHGERGL